MRDGLRKARASTGIRGHELQKNDLRVIWRPQDTHRRHVGCSFKTFKIRTGHFQSLLRPLQKVWFDLVSDRVPLKATTPEPERGT